MLHLTELVAGEADSRVYNLFVQWMRSKHSGMDTELSAYQAGARQGLFVRMNQRDLRNHASIGGSGSRSWSPPGS